MRLLASQAFCLSQFALAPEGPSDVARGVSPWFWAVSLCPSPVRGDIARLDYGNHVAPHGARKRHDAPDQGLAPLATSCRPSGADSRCIIVCTSERATLLTPEITSSPKGGDGDLGDLGGDATMPLISTSPELAKNNWPTQPTRSRQTRRAVAQSVGAKEFTRVPTLRVGTQIPTLCVASP